MNYLHQKRYHFLSFLGFFIALFVFKVSAAEVLPTSIKVVVPFAPGGAADSVGRLFAQQIADLSGKAVIVENKPGAGSMIGTEFVIRSPKDGGTLLVAGNALIFNRIMKSKMNYDFLVDLEPICMLVDSPGVIVVNSSSEFQKLEQWIEYAKNNPGKLSFGAVGPASATQLAGEMLKDAASVDITYVPFPGAAPAVTALLGNHISSVFALYSEVAPLIKAGKLRALAVTSRSRFSALKDTPTVAESGYKDFEMSIWVGAFGPSKIANSMTKQLEIWFYTALQSPELKSKLMAQELSPGVLCGKDFSVYLQNAVDKYSRIIKSSNMKFE